MRIKRWMLTALFLVLAGAGVVMAQSPQQFEQATHKRASQVLPPAMVRGPHFRVQDQVIYDGYTFRFSVVSEDRKSTRLNSSHIQKSRMPSSA